MPLVVHRKVFSILLTLLDGRTVIYRYRSRVTRAQVQSTVWLPCTVDHIFVLGTKHRWCTVVRLLPRSLCLTRLGIYMIEKTRSFLLPSEKQVHVSQLILLHSSTPSPCLQTAKPTMMTKTHIKQDYHRQVLTILRPLTTTQTGHDCLIVGPVK